MEPGAEGRVEHVVADTDTAMALGSGDVPVLGTPLVIALCERAAVEAVAPSLADGQTSVGTTVAIDHLAPTLVGSRVVATARLGSVDGRRLEFAVEVRDDAGVVATGSHTRVLVDRARFLESARTRS